MTGWENGRSGLLQGIPPEAGTQPRFADYPEYEALPGTAVSTKTGEWNFARGGQPDLWRSLERALIAAKARLNGANVYKVIRHGTTRNGLFPGDRPWWGWYRFATPRAGWTNQSYLGPWDTFGWGGDAPLELQARVVRKPPWLTEQNRYEPG